MKESELYKGPYIQFKDLSLKIKGNDLFSGFNLEIARGEVLMLKGPSGRGKSTLLKMLPGFIQADAGEILLEGQALNKKTVRSFRERISYVSQDTDLPNLRVEDLLEEIQNYKINKERNFSREKIREYLHDFSLENQILDKKVRELSGGERQRLGIVITLLLDREIWLLDEITSALDPKLKEYTVERLLDAGKTIILCSHDSPWEKDSRVRVVEL